MRLIGLVLLITVFLSSIIYAEENCELALPRYGTVKCENMNQQQTMSINLNDNENQESVGSHVCLSNCKLNTMTDIPSIDCGGWGTHIEIFVNGENKYSESSTTPRYDRTIEFNRDEELTFRGYCRGFFGGKRPLPIPSFSLKEDLIKLVEAWAGSLEFTPIDGTEGCSLNAVVDKYKGEAEVDSYYNPETGEAKSKPSSTYSSPADMPTNWEISDSYVFVKSWETGVADISITYDKNDNGYWCGGLTGSRKIYKVNEINSRSGKCYAIPTGVALSNVECCFASDCAVKGSKYTCNPETWKCEETKPCNSQLDCDQTFGEGICENKQITKWTCDTNKKWSDYIGTCVKALRNVEQCDSDCTGDEYYNEEEGKCKPRNVLINCPSGKCCLPGGSYKEKSCSGNLKCCTSSGYLGNCQESCTSTDSNDKITGLVPTQLPESSSSTGLIIIGLIVLMLGGTGIFYLRKRKKNTIRESKSNNKGNNSNLEFCPKCGSPLRDKSKFCTKCGKAI